MANFKQYYVTEGFQDEHIGFLDRYAKAIEYFTMDRTIFAGYEQHDKLSNTDISPTRTYAQLDRHTEACDALAMSIETMPPTSGRTPT